MKFALDLSLILVGAAGAAAIPGSVSWAQPLEAPPEAVVIGGALLVFASVLRRGLPHKTAK